MRWIVLVIVAVPFAASAQVAEICDNRYDDDGDELVDCRDSDCATRESCARNVEPPAPHEEPLSPKPSPDDDPRRYPQLYSEQPLTLLSGMLVPMLGISVRDDLAIFERHGHFGIGLAYGIFDFWEIAILPLPLRVSPYVAYEDPSISTTVRFLDHEVIELGLYANVAIPVTQTVGPSEPLVTEQLLARSRSGSTAELDVALPTRFHIAQLVRIDLVPAVTFVFTPDVRVDVAIPLRVTAQLSPYAFAGVWSGIVISGSNYSAPKIPFGFLFGTTIPGWERGPLADITLRIGWPTFWDPERIGLEVTGDGWQITLDARLLTYLLP